MKVEFADKTDLSVVHWPHCDILLCLVLLCVLCVYVFDTCVERNICTSCVAEPSCGLGEFCSSHFASRPPQIDLLSFLSGSGLSKYKRFKFRAAF